MIQRTAIVVGPGGIGKSPLDTLFKDNIIKIDPYRLRSDGPRNSNDIHYTHPRLRNELHLVLTGSGDQVRQIDYPDQHIDWFPKSEVLFFKVRDDWQFLILNGLEGQIAKAEIYAPVLPTFLSTPSISSLLGKTDIIVLNPALESVTVMRDWKDLEAKAEHNCTERGDPFKSVQRRVASIANEAPAWQKLILENDATEYSRWEFPEYIYKRPAPGIRMLEHQKRTLMGVRNRLLEGNPDLDIFFKTDEEIEQITEPFVK